MVIVNKLRAELLALGYGRGEVDNVLRELAGGQDTRRLSPTQQKMLSITMQERLDFYRAADYQKKQLK